MEIDEGTNEEQGVGALESSLGNENVDLKEEKESENSEADMGVPEEESNDAGQLNIGNVFIAIIAAIVIIIGIIALFSKKNKKENGASDELSKAGDKYIPDVRIREKKPDDVHEDDEYSEKKIDEILKTLPETYQPAPQPDPSPAPVAPVGSTGSSSGSSRSQRPDTRNSKSPRRIEGILGQDYQAQDANNKNIISAMMNGAYMPQQSQQYQAPSSYSLSRPQNKDEYMEQIMSKTGSHGYGNGGDISRTQQYQMNKDEFYNNGLGGNGAGSGQYLSYGALWEGTVISAALQTAINTDNPGLVIARVTENVYSSYDSSFLLVPEGTLLYATYNSSVSYGQNKVQVAWNLMIRPDGYKVQLGNMNGVNAQGASGYRGHVTTHPFETLKALGMVWIYSMIQTEMNAQVKNTQNQYVQNAMADTYAEVSKIGSKIIDRALDIKPTITIKPGTKVKLITNVTLELPPVKVNPVTRRYVRTR